MELSPAKRALMEKWLKGKQPIKKMVGIPRRPVNSPISLSFPQQRQIFLELLDPGTAVNNLSVFLKMEGKLDWKALEQSANQILARHEVLRTHFSMEKGTPSPIILEEINFTLPVVDLLDTEAADQEKKARRLAEIEVSKPFDLSQTPLIRLKLYKLNQEKHLLLVAAHHTVADGWSLGVFLKELMLFYEANTIGKTAEVHELAIQYTDYAYWQTDQKRKEILHSSMSYWKKQLAGEIPILELPIDFQRSARQTFLGGTHRFVIDRDLTEALEKLSRQEDVTLFMTLLTVFNILLHRYSGQEEILVGTPIANRNLPELEGLIGVFINTLVLRTKLSGNPSFSELLKNVRKTSTEAYAHQDLPFEKLVEELKPKRDLSRTPLFQVVFNLQNSPMPKLEIAGLETSFLEIDRGVSQFDLTLMVSKIDGQCHATVEFNKDLFQAQTIARMFQSYQMLLKEVITQPDLPKSKLQISPPEQLNRLLYDRNQTVFDFPENKCFHQLFEEQVEKTPDAVALIHIEAQLRYLELNQVANKLAKQLQEMGVGPEVSVGVLMSRSLEMVKALLAVHKAGGIYVPIHTSFPTARIQFILKDADVKVLLTNIDTGSLDKTQLHILNCTNENLSPTVAHSNLISNVNPKHVAYIIYTSGSTGNPKGVVVNHSSLVNFLWSMRNSPGINQGDRLLAVTSISFDIAALELFSPLIVGGTVVIASEEMVSNPQLLSEAIDHHHVNIMQATPAMWQILLGIGWEGKPDLKALCGGEALSRKLANKLLARVDVLWNMYGPTETTIWSSINLIQKGDSPITIGQAIANTQLYILDREQQPVPPGVIGELYIGGAGLARGYLKQSQMTKEKFIPDLLREQIGARLYKTGDYARYVENDSIEILGRMDNQLKINGNRIELGEIQNVLIQNPLVSDAIVIAKTEKSGDKRLIAYFISKHSPTPGVKELTDFVRKQLPSYMIPTFFIALDSFPLNTSGKVDRKALPMPEGTHQRLGYLAPRNEEEQILVEIWQNVLETERVGIHDNFFDLGGASIQSLQIVAKANMYGFKLSVENLFEYQTIAELAALIKNDLQ